MLILGTYLFFACEEKETPIIEVEDIDNDGFTTAMGDCDDFNNLVNPSVAEVCDGIDNNCNDEIDEEAIDAPSFFIDGDGDGYPLFDELIQECEIPENGILFSSVDVEDCNDDDSSIYPMAARLEPSLCTIDQDGDGYGDSQLDETLGDRGSDCNDENEGIYPGSLPLEGPLFCGLDNDEDGFGDQNAEMPYSAGSDCDDTNSSTSPLTPEICDEVDNNCDNEIDNNPVDTKTWYFDLDNDGFGSDSIVDPIAACTQPDNYVTTNNDCDDNDVNIHPSQVEFCDNLDNNCNGSIDEGQDETAPANAPHWYIDTDGDGHAGDSFITSCAQPEGTFESQTDCDDTNSSIFPEAEEVCDGLDQDCDGEVDEESTNAPIWYLDSDGDGFVGDQNTIVSCNAPANASQIIEDCDDNNINIHPNANETCDGIDENCDEIIDNDAIDMSEWFMDSDGDGFGYVDETQTSVYSCSKPEGYTNNTEDCDDTNLGISPLGIEICDSIDNDCDELIDDEDENIQQNSQSKYYADIDDDGFGNAYDFLYRCIQPDNYISDQSDCDDTNPQNNPQAEEYCDEIDNNCNGEIDEDPVDTMIWYLDADADGRGDSNSTHLFCLNASPSDMDENYVLIDGDCDDSDPLRSPDNYELCTTDIDENCDDDAQLGAIDPNVYYTDIDEDGFGNNDLMVQTCSELSYLTDLGNDCDDFNASVYPNAVETCDGILNNCTTTESLIYIDDVPYPTNEWDDDGDGYVECGIDVENWRGDENILGGNDCDDTRDFMYPTAPEICNGQYDDCNMIGELISGTEEWDDDGDGFVECSPIGEWFGQESVLSSDGTPLGNDCNDYNVDVYLGAASNYPQTCTQDTNGDGNPDCVYNYSDGYFCDDTLTVNSLVGIDMVRIPSSPSLDFDYMLTKDFMMMTTEVTRSLFSAVMDYDPSNNACSGDCPVEDLYRRDAMHFANKISDIAELPNCYDCIVNESGTLESCSIKVAYDDDFTSCLGYRLPTEAEWEYAAQSGSQENIWTIDGGGFASAHNCSEGTQIEDGGANPELSDYAWYCANTSGPRQVGQKIPNGIGLYDMLGNVLEWTQDNIVKYSHWSYSQVPFNPIDPYSPLGTMEVAKGGSYYENSSITYAYRKLYNSNYKHQTVGVRLAKTVNNLPKRPKIWIDEHENASLLCSITEESYDLEGDEVTYSFSWQLNQSNYEGELLDTVFEGDTIPSEMLNEGDLWNCTVTPSDNYGTGFAASESYIIETDTDVRTVLLSEIGEDSFEFVRIIGGDDPLGRYTLERDLWVQSTEVHQSLYMKLINQNPSSNQDCPTCPVEMVDRNDAMVFANQMSKWEGLEVCYDCSYEYDYNFRTVSACEIRDSLLEEGQSIYDCEGYRLPTEAEWEYIARGNTSSDISTSSSSPTFILSNQCSSNSLSDNTLLEDYSWLCSNASETNPVGSKLPTNDALYDLHGNVSEWVHDDYHSTFPNENSNPLFIGGSYGITRGGNYESSPNQLKSSYRSPTLTNTKNEFIGFRVVRSIFEGE